LDLGSIASFSDPFSQSFGSTKPSRFKELQIDYFLRCANPLGMSLTEAVPYIENSYAC
jgi:hypothetical protein